MYPSLDMGSVRFQYGYCFTSPAPSCTLTWLMDLPLAIISILVVSVTLWAWGKYQTSSLPPLCECTCLQDAAKHLSYDDGTQGPRSTCEVLRRQPWRWYAQIARTHGTIFYSGADIS